MAGGRARTIAEAAGALLCAGLLVTTLVVTLVAGGAPGSTGHRVGKGLPAPKRVAATSDPGLRRLPLLQPGGVVETGFPDGQGLDDPPRLAPAVLALAGRLGLDTAIYTLLSTSLTDPHADPIHQINLYDGYPYSYPRIDPIVDADLTAQAVQADPGALLDLTGLLLDEAVASQRDSDGGSEPNSWAAVAYSLLRRARDLAPSCDIQLQLTDVVAMGFAPHVFDLEAEVGRTRSACPGDPTALWLLGQVQTVEAVPEQHNQSYELAPAEMALAADQTFRELRQQFPRSPLGYAGPGDLLLQQADVEEARGEAPFERQVQRREALRWYAEARARSGDPTLLAGWGRALLGLGRDDEAVAALTRLDEAVPREPAYETLLSEALVRAHRWQAAATYLTSTMSDPRPLMQSLYLTPQSVDGEPASFAYGAAGARSGVAFDQTTQYSEGASVADTGFVPESRGTWYVPWCRAGALYESLLAAGRAADAWSLFESGIQPASWDGKVGCHGQPLPAPDGSGMVQIYTGSSVEDLAVVAAMAVGGDSRDQELALVARAEVVKGYQAQSEGYDDLTDFWRSIGAWDRAAAAIRAWTTALPPDPWAQKRAGEVAFLRHDYGSAVSAYTRASALFEKAVSSEASWGDHGFDTDVGAEVDGQAQTALELGAAEDYGGDGARAAADYRVAIADAKRNLRYSELQLEIDFYANSQLGEQALGAEQYGHAVAYLSASLKGVYSSGFPKPGAYVAGTGAQENNLALALARSGHHGSQAVDYAQAALDHDPADPVYVDTLAFCQQLDGRSKAAAATYRRALVADPTSYVSANNLAVLLAQSGDRRGAISLLEAAVRVAPGYATGWHNLGLVREPSSALLLTSQGALARAGSLDRAFRGSSGLRVDTTVYRSGLDVSKPIPPHWRYASTASAPTDRFTLTMLLLLALRAAWALGLDKVVGVVNERVIARSRKGAPRRRGFWRHLHPGWALAAAVLVLGLPVARAGRSGLERGLLVGSVVALVLLPFLLRRLVGLRSSQDVGHVAWAPAIAVGLIGVPFGLAFVPYPSMQSAPEAAPTSDRARDRIRWVVPAVVAPIAGAFLLVAAVEPAPLARTVALAATALLGSVLTPVPPLDGAHYENRLVNLAATVLLALATVAFTLQWI